MGEVNMGTASFLHSSLGLALSTLSSYEGSGSGMPINNTGYALGELISNGMIYGTNEIALMGGSTLVNYTNSIEREAESEGLNLTITNATLHIYQGGPYSINATYSALGTINSSSGVFSYPIVASSGILLNGSTDLYSVQRGGNNHVIANDSYPGALLVGNVVQQADNAVLAGNVAAIASNNYDQFVYGTVIVENAVNSCGSIPSQFRNANYILATKDDMMQGSCGFGGIITFDANSPPYSVPYLEYYSNSEIFNHISNGTKLLLNGPGNSLLDISGIVSAMHSGDYYGSSFAPSYLDWAEGDVNGRAQFGLYSFSLYNRQVPVFTSNGIKSISMSQVLPTSAAQFSVSLWFSPSNSAQSGNIVQQGAFSLGQTAQEVSFASSCGSVDSGTISSILPDTWHSFVAVYNLSSTPSNTYIYIDGTLAGNGISCGMGSGNFVTGGSSFTGSISNIQVYNAPLNQYQAAELYHDGIDGLEVYPSSIVGWWPLDGNPDDIVGSNNGNAVLSGQGALSYTYLYGYAGNPVYGGSFYNSSTANVVEGYNCANIGQCCDHSLQHLYLYNASLSSNAGSAVTEAEALGVANALLPYC